MDNQNKIFIYIISGVIAIGILVAIFYRPTVWVETYRADDKEPYGTSILHDVLEKSSSVEHFKLIKKEDTIYKSFPLEDIPVNSNYIFIGQRLFLNEKETEFLLDFAKQGNNVYLISKRFDQEILDSLFQHPNEILAQLMERVQLEEETEFEDFIPCGYYSQDEEWIQTEEESPNGFFDEEGYWQELHNPYDSTAIEILEEGYYDDDGYWIDPYDEFVDIEEPDSIGYYGKDGYWMNGRDSMSRKYSNYYKDQSYDADNYIGMYSDSTNIFNFLPSELTLENSLEIYRVHKQKPISYNWQYFKTRVEEDQVSNPTLLGGNEDDYINYIQVRYGKGNFYLHTTPLIFSNYFLMNKECYDYVNVVFGDMGTGNTYWDESSRINENMPLNEFDFNDPKYHPNEGPLSFILSQEGLKLAWSILLISLVLYLIFGLRRKQRVIPVLPRNTNTSKEYAETIAQLYMQKGSHIDIYRLKMDMFKAFLRDRYGINTVAKTEEEINRLIEIIVIKSDVKPEHVKDIFKTYNFIFMKESLSTKDLVYFHDLLEEFYTNCK